MFAYSMNPTDVLCGSRTSTGTILTIPAGRQWCGSILISASLTGLGSATPSVTVSGSGANPVDGSVVHELSLNALLSVASTDSATVDLIAFAPAGNDITLEFATGGATSASVVANGFVI